MERTSSARWKLFPSTHCCPGPRLMVRRPIYPDILLLLQTRTVEVLREVPMELFARLFESVLLFMYHCFDRVVIHGYLSGLSRPEQAVYFFRDVIGEAMISKEVLSRRTQQ